MEPVNTLPVELVEDKHPQTAASKRFKQLVGLQAQAESLTNSLRLILEPSTTKEWATKHHPAGLFVDQAQFNGPPLILLSGDVGCGKTELANAIGTPLAKELGGKSVRTFLAPSDLRGGGLVGQLSLRITAAFKEARRKLKRSEIGLLIIDEADDMASARWGSQVHHEDRAGVNALIKEVDALGRDHIPIAVLLITNRPSALDPAVMRRTIAHIEFSRPKGAEIRQVLQRLLTGIEHTEQDVESIAAFCDRQSPPLSYSDYFVRAWNSALAAACPADVPLTVDRIKQALQQIQPSPQIIEP